MFNFLLHISVFLLFSLLSVNLSAKVARLHSENFEDHVLLDSDPWILGIEKRIRFDTLERIYEQVRGRAKIGIIEEKELSTYLREQVTPNASIYFFQIPKSLSR